ncbi:tyrosine-type recombinase/integrase [Acetobacter fallax]|uniref:Tyrosine-type recombinase/integrase n=1 Tax=Acetobacter fallax TaxID=1737473 RepID=A0ABX0KC23_9PROT|nr:site-specific integrase [Acetobacter fallax]NHO33530.1 tyrosine-type recombinase/integrase [Acetobacter fallax]NHO37127.1 tyrosine-type recombinase/integrase [Acetobacter fallax]
MSVPNWSRYPLVARDKQSRLWLSLLDNLGRSPATVDAYARGLDQYLAFCAAAVVEAEAATLAHVSLFVRYLRGEPVPFLSARLPVGNATLHQRLTAVRLWYDHLVFEGICTRNPVPRGQAVVHRGPLPQAHVGFRYGLVRRSRRLPHLPSDDEWIRIQEAVSREIVRNRLMFALAYYGALRREELVGLRVSDIDPARRLLTIRAETSKSARPRVVCYSAAVSPVLAVYLQCRRDVVAGAGPLFLSESDRNLRQPVTKWTWSKAVGRLAHQADAPGFSTHTLRHLRLTHLARAGWRLHDIATYAGHRNVQSTTLYIHLSGEDLLRKIAHSVERMDMKLGNRFFGG